MTVRQKESGVFITGLDDREGTEVRRIMNPNASKVERHQGLLAFLSRNGINVENHEAEIFVWA